MIKINIQFHDLTDTSEELSAEHYGPVSFNDFTTGDEEDLNLLDPDFFEDADHRFSDWFDSEELANALDNLKGNQGEFFSFEFEANRVIIQIDRI